MTSDIADRCPSLFKTILPPLDLLDDTADSIFYLQGNSSPKNPRVINRIKHKTVKDRSDAMLQVLFPRKLTVTFVAALLDAYSRDYNPRNFVELRRPGLQWCKKLYFLYP